MARYLTVLSLLFSLCLACAPMEGQAAPPGSFADMAEKLVPAVVNISTTQKVKPASPFKQFDIPVPPGSPFEQFRDFFEQMEPPGGEEGFKATSLGSGFVIDSSGYIVTNNHVIADADEITVTFSDETKLIAKVVGRDEKTDLALLKVDANHKLPSADFGDSDKVRVGDWVLAIGNPFGLGGSVSVGIVSARARDINAGPFDDFLQTDAAINKGNSGGPMFDVNGNVVGINTAIFSPSGGSVGIGFAMPSSLAQPVIEQLKKYGRTYRGWLGVKIQEVTDEIANSVGLGKAAGALVVEVTPESPAAKSGVQVGDIVTEFDSRRVSHMRQLPRMVADTDIGKKSSLKVFRQGKTLSFDITLGELEESPTPEEAKESIPDGSKLPAGAKDMLYLTLAPLTTQLRQDYNIAAEINGLLVVGVKEKDPEITKGITIGDVIVSANQQPMNTLEALEKTIQDAEKKKRGFVLVMVKRGEDVMFVPLPLESKKKG